jgi:hypothetical protein
MFAAGNHRADEIRFHSTLLLNFCGLAYIGVGFKYLADILNPPLAHNKAA